MRALSRWVARPGVLTGWREGGAVRLRVRQPPVERLGWLTMVCESDRNQLKET